MPTGPSIVPSTPRDPTPIVYSLRSELPLRMLRSKTPASALPYSAGKAPDRKSEYVSTLALNMLMPPLLWPPSPKWFGLGISMPSSCHTVYLGDCPRTITSLSKSSSARDTPEKDCAMRAGSDMLAAYRCVCSTEKERALTVAASLSGTIRSGASDTSTISMVTGDGIRAMSSASSLPAVSSSCETCAGS